MLQFKFPKVKLDQESTVREKAIFVLVLVGVFIFFSNSVWDPTLAKIKALRVEAKSAELQVDAIKKLMEAAEAQMSKKKQQPTIATFTDPRIAKILSRRVMDPADEINSTVDLLNKRNVVGRAEVKNVTVGDKADKPAYSTVPLVVDISGTYSDVQSYIRAIENLDRPVLVNSFSIQSDKDKQGSLVAKLDVMLYIVKR